MQTLVVRNHHHHTLRPAAVFNPIRLEANDDEPCLDGELCLELLGDGHEPTHAVFHLQKSVA